MNKISIIIPTLNEEHFIRGILSDLHKQTYKPYEIVVVDGKSTDKTANIIQQFPDVRYVQMDPNPASQRDKGAKLARGDILVFFDADTRIAPLFLEGVLKAFSSSSIAVACPRYVPIEKNISGTIVYSLFNEIFYLVQKILPSGAGSCIIVRRKTYMELGGFESRYRFDDMHFLSKVTHKHFFGILPLVVRVSTRRIRKMGLLASLFLYLRLSWYFMFKDYEGANSIAYPFGNHDKDSR